MKLILENIGLIKKADINIDSICVIAGENNNGKSTVGKAIMSLIKSDNTARHKYKQHLVNNFFAYRINNFNKLIELLFENNISNDGYIKLIENDKTIYDVSIKNNKCIKFDGLKNKDKRDILDCTYIQTPLVWDLYDFFSSILVMRSEDEIYGFSTPIKYPYILWDLYTKLSIKRLNTKKDNNSLILAINSIINGEFSQENNRFYYIYNNQKIELINTATGVKSFAIILVLLMNNYITKFGLFIFDEPEIHLHPKWQLKFVEILVLLAKNGTKIIINTHSPYIVEAIEKYTNKYQINSNFYLAEDGYILENDNALEKIFEKLSEPIV